MKYKNIFFDLDDTLVDTIRSAKESLVELYYNLYLNNYFESVDDFINQFHIINEKLWTLYERNKISKDLLKINRFKEILAKHISLTDSEADELNNTFMHKVASKKNVVEGVVETLDYLQNKGYDLHIISNGFSETQNIKLKSAGIEHYFKTITLSDQIGINKPNPILFEHALKKASAENTSSIMIGDNIDTDIKGAHLANIDQVWFNPQKKSLANIHQPTFSIVNIKELKQIL